MKGQLDRTKVVLRHLPPSFTRGMLMDRVDAGFAGRYDWVAFRPGKSSQKQQTYSRAYINFKRPEDGVEFTEFFDGHVFVNEKGTQFKAVVEYAPSQWVAKLTCQKDGREGTLLKGLTLALLNIVKSKKNDPPEKFFMQGYASRAVGFEFFVLVRFFRDDIADPGYLEFLEILAKPVENLPGAEIQLERREAERSGTVKETPIITPLMDFVRQKRASKAASRELSVTANGCVSLASIHNSFKETATIERPVVLGFSANNFRKMAAFEERLSPIKRKTIRCLPMRFLHKIIDPEYPCGSSFPAKKIKRTCMEDPLVPVSGTSAESISELRDAEPLCLRAALRLTYNDVNPLRECENKEAGSSVTGAFNGKDNANNHTKGSNRRRKSSKPTRVVEKADGVYNKSSIEEQLFVGTRLTHEEKRGEVQNIEDVSKYTFMEDQSIAAVGTDMTEKERGEVQNRESIHKNPYVEEASHMACRTELNCMERGHSHVVENGGMSLGTEGVSEEQRAGDGVVEVDQSLPFVKSSPIWQTVESLEVFQKFPQNPHFLPLIEERERVREGLAIAKMVTFANTAENIIKLSLDDPANRFTDCLETIRSLVLHGFDIKAMENRLTKLIALKDEGQKMEEQKNEIENQNSELTHANAQLAKDICEIMDKIRSYQEQVASAQWIKEEKDSKISILKTSLDLMDRVIRGAQVSFEELNVSW